MTKDEALKLALEAFEYPGNIWHMDCPKDKTLTAIRKVLAQPEHSCVACEGNPKGNNNPCAVCHLSRPPRNAGRHTDKRQVVQDRVAYEESISVEKIDKAIPPSEFNKRKG